MALTVLPAVISEQAGAANLYVFSVADQKQYATPNAQATGQYVIEVGGPVRGMVNLTVRKQAGGVESITLRTQDTFIHTGGIASIVVHSTTVGSEVRISKFIDSSLTPTSATPERDAGGGYLPYSPEDTAGAEFYTTQGYSYTLRDENDGNGAIGWYFIKSNSGSFYYRPFGSRTITTLSANPATNVAYRNLYDVGTHVLVFTYSNASSGFTGIRVYAYNKSTNSWSTITTIGASNYGNTSGLPMRQHFMYNNRLYPVADDNGYYYDGASAWARTAVLVHPTQWNTGAYVNGYWMTSGSLSNYISTTYAYQVYNAAANTWTAREHAIGQQGRGGVVLRASATEFAVWGRTGAGNAINNASADGNQIDLNYRYNPSTNVWTDAGITNNNRHRLMRMFNQMVLSSSFGYTPVNKYGSDGKHIVAANNASAGFQTSPGQSGVYAPFVDVNAVITVTDLKVNNGGVSAQNSARPYRVSGKRHIFATGQFFSTQQSSQSFNNATAAQPSFGSTIISSDGIVTEGFMPDFRVDRIAYSADDNAFYMLGYTDSRLQDGTSSAALTGTGTITAFSSVWQQQTRRVSDIDLKVEILSKARSFYSTDMDGRAYPGYMYSSTTTLGGWQGWPNMTWYDNGKLFYVEYQASGTYSNTVRIIPMIQSLSQTTTPNFDTTFQWQSTNASNYATSGYASRVGLTWYPPDTNKLPVDAMRQAAFAGFVDNTRYPEFGDTRRPMFWTGAVLYSITGFGVQNDGTTATVPTVTLRIVADGHMANPGSQNIDAKYGINNLPPNVFWANEDGKIVAETSSGFVTMRRSGTTDEVWFTPSMEYPRFGGNLGVPSNVNLPGYWGSSDSNYNTYTERLFNNNRQHCRATLGGTEHYVLGCHQMTEWYNGSNFNRYSNTNNNFYKVTHG